VPPGNGRPAKRTLITDSDGGSTLYIGSRSSDRFARLYDKGREQRALPAGKWWRLELEVKGKSSQKVAEQLLSVETPDRASLATVAKYFRRKAALSIPACRGALICNEGRNPTTADRQLRWLSHQVRGTVQTLVKTVGRERVLEALNLRQSNARDL
jgi:DNA relaxase NicK